MWTVHRLSPIFNFYFDGEFHQILFLEYLFIDTFLSLGITIGVARFIGLSFLLHTNIDLNLKTADQRRFETWSLRLKVTLLFCYAPWKKNIFCFPSHVQKFVKNWKLFFWVNFSLSAFDVFMKFQSPLTKDNLTRVPKIPNRCKD